MSSDLVGRDRELAEVRRWLEEAGRAPSGLVILGEPGIGKTSVWEQVGREAAAGGWRLLVCRCVKSEAQLSYAALGDLLRDVLPKLLDRMAPPRRRALAAALLLEEAGGGAAPDARAVGLAFLDALRGLAEGGPLLVAIDDLHWLDPPSRDAIAFALRRLHAERIGLSATIRSSQEPVEATLGQLPFIRSLTIGPISLAATFQLVRSRLGLALSRPQLIRIHDAAGGNPLFALELAAELQRLGPAAPGAPLAIRGDLREHLGRRISRLAPATRRVLAFASASPRLSRARLRAVAGSVAVDAALLDAEAAVVVAAGSDPVRFTHPLLAAAGYAAADDRLRRQVHRRLARLSADPEEQARHLALATDAPDAAIAATLEEAASGAALRGATAASGELLEMAAARTPAGRERERRGRLLRAAENYRLAGDRPRSTAVLEALLPLVERGSERSDALFALARAGPADLRRVTALCEDALAEAGDDHARAASVLTYLSWVRMLQADIRAALHDAREGLRRAELAGDPALVARAIARVAMSETWTLEITPGLLERGVKIENGLDRWLELHASPRWTLARRLKLADEFDAARELTETAEADAAARGDEVTHTLVQYFRVGLETAAGRWNEAMRRANEGAELAEQLQDEQLRGMMADARAAVLVLLGREAEARAALRDALAVSDAASDELLRIGKLDALGLLELSLGNMRTAADLLRPLPGRLLGLGWNHPMVIQGPNAIEALAGVGELDLAERHLAAYEARARRAGLPTALATAARCRGLLAAARSDLVFAVEALESALVLHDAGAQPFERARTLLALGGVRRRAKQKRQAREALSDALDAFESLGARLWAEKARHELDQIGGRRSEGAALTATEQQLAGLVARGLSNREVAASLYVTVHTVEGHLTTIYRKLGIRSRTQLAILMRDPP